MVADGTAAAVRRAAPSLSASNTAFVISSTNSGMPSVRSTISTITSAGNCLFPTRRPMIVATDAVRFGDALQPRRLVRRLSQDAALLRVAGPDQIADHHE